MSLVRAMAIHIFQVALIAQAHGVTADHCVDGHCTPSNAVVLLQKDQHHSRLSRRTGFNSTGEEEVQCSRMWNKYHSSRELLDCFVWFGMQGRCAVPLSTEWVQDRDDVSKKLFVARLGNSNAEKNLLVAANEHARELITAEVALRFLELACDGSSGLANTLLDVGVTILPVVNLKGRILAETSKPCQRYTVASEGSIDLNRNMDVDFRKSSDHGDRPFSTYQARIMRDIAVAVRPVAYVDLHSGAKSLMVSWGARDGVSPDWDAQKRMLLPIKEEFCNNCVMGSNKLVIGYTNEGEIIDHMYAKQGIKYSTLWEVWQGGSSCFSMFNPPNDELERVSRTWAGALAKTAEFVHTNVSADERSMPGALETAPLDAIMLEEHGQRHRPPQMPEHDMLTT